jgi:hypothetical protein
MLYFPFDNILTSCIISARRIEMPVIAVRLDEKLYDQLSELVSAGGYRNLQQLIDVALRNHLTLEQTVEGAGLISTGKTSADYSSAYENQSSKDRSSQNKPGGDHRNKTQTDDRQEAFRQELHSKFQADRAQLFKSFRYEENDPKGPTPCLAEIRPIEERMYSLVNRLFPLKLTARWIDIKAARMGHWPPVDEALGTLRVEASKVGAIMARIDRETGRQRDDQLATSLPRPDRPDSEERFTTQFLLRPVRNGCVRPGALIQMALASLRNGQLVLTHEGQRLARIVNPMIDLSSNEITEILCREERELFVSQVQNYMPAEASDISAVLIALGMERATPGEVLMRLRGQFPLKQSEVAFRSHVSGLIARMVEMGLLKRKWEGRNAYYLREASVDWKSAAKN